MQQVMQLHFYVYYAFRAAAMTLRTVLLSIQVG